MRIGLVILLISFSAFMGCDKSRDCLYVEKAKLSQFEKHVNYLHQVYKDEQITLDNHEFIVTGHRIESGTGTILALRIFDSGSFAARDTATFEKITIYLPHDISDRDKEEYSITANSGIIAFYSWGNSSFPSAGCFGYAKAGFIRLRRIDPERLSADITLKIDLISPTEMGAGDCDFIDYRSVSELHRKAVADITTWEGKLGETIRHETYRK